MSEKYNGEIKCYAYRRERDDDFAWGIVRLTMSLVMQNGVVVNPRLVAWKWMTESTGTIFSAPKFDALTPVDFSPKLKVDLGLISLSLSEENEWVMTIRQDVNTYVPGSYDMWPETARDGFPIKALNVDGYETPPGEAASFDVLAP